MSRISCEDSQKNFSVITEQLLQEQRTKQSIIIFVLVQQIEALAQPKKAASETHLDSGDV